MSEDEQDEDGHAATKRPRAYYPKKAVAGSLEQVRALHHHSPLRVRPYLCVCFACASRAPEVARSAGAKAL